ncbi:MAG: DEAD/DEAH box helicase [Verrucomicrobia bacterium]|nr:DEAD/DEAH box helicase [Verrucomicrobiota bacterium]
MNLPDLWQQDAVRHLKTGADVIIDAPTGAGKTRVFELFLKTPEAARLGQAVYTVPTRALANDKWREWKSLGWNVGIATGDLAENLHAPVLVATLETQRERILSGNAPGFLILDEYQMLADAQRGLNSDMAMALPLASTRLLLLSGSVRNPADIAEWLKRLGRRVELIQVKNRPVPLDQFPVENLPRVPDSVHGFWPRVAVAALHAGLTPLLLFAPRRRDAEKMATQIAAALPVDSPLLMAPEDQNLLGRDLTRLLRHRVAFHHSGLPYSARADWIEPLGKAGKLHVIVATTGLAAGINFSVRSVMVTSTSYGDARFQRELRSDELLQMFGRAGRRGLDERGFVLTAPNLPGLLDASPRQLRRVNQMDWPTLLRVMEAGASDGSSPLARAALVCERLFSRQKIAPDLANALGTSPSSERHGPTRVEFLGLADCWHPLKSAVEQMRPLGLCLARHKERWIPALRDPHSLELLPHGRACKIPEGRSFAYGKEVSIARLAGTNFEPLPWIQKLLGLRKTETFTEDELIRDIIPLLESQWSPGFFHSTACHGANLMARLSLANIPVSAIILPDGTALLDPPRRRVSSSFEVGESPVFNPAPGSAAYAWRKLGLVDDCGSPTPRGRLFSRFQGGEGLMVAAALEDLAYPVEDIVTHLANLRGGPRFMDFADGPSHRLAAVAREIYGHIDHEGYLQGGLCPGFGEGACEALSLHRSGGMRALEKETDSIRRGDIERAILEWKSLLRHLLHAEDPLFPRWDELQAAARQALEKPVS